MEFFHCSLILPVEKTFSGCCWITSFLPSLLRTGPGDFQDDQTRKTRDTFFFLHVWRHFYSSELNSERQTSNYCTEFIGFRDTSQGREKKKGHIEACCLPREGRDGTAQCDCLSPVSVMYPLHCHVAMCSAMLASGLPARVGQTLTADEARGF